MTGFGIGEAKLGNGRLLVEMRSLNHRFLEVRVRTPGELNEHSFFIEQLCREKLHRGRYDVSVRLEHSEPERVSFQLDRARQVYAALIKLRDELTPGAEVPIAALAGIPGLFDSPGSNDVEASRAALSDALTHAIRALDAMKEGEGKSLQRELAARLGAAENLRTRILEQSAVLVSQHRARLKERLDKLLGDAGVSVDQSRLEAELAILADRSDVTEELVRLQSHFEQFGKLLSSHEAVGRRLDFLLQEIGRETNTVGSKCQDASLTGSVVELKAEVERMREQVQNVE